MNVKVVTVCLAVSILLVGCQSETSSLEREAVWSQSITEMQDLRCEGMPDPGEPDSVLSVHVFLGEHVDPASVKPLIADAAGVLAEVGLRIEVDPKVQRIPRDTLFTVDPSKLRKAIQKGAPLAKLEALLLQGIKVMIQTHSRPRRNAVHWFFMQEIAPDSGMAARILGEVAGVGLSPELVAFESNEKSGQSWVEAAGLNGEFTPTVVFSVDALRRQNKASRAVTILHEMGHAFGLPHTDLETTVLMNLEPGNCLPPLSEEQAQAFENRGRKRK